MLEGNNLYEFGPFRLDPAERSLLRDGKPVPLTPKAFELLVLLVENRGHLLKKDELIERVWPNTFVEEANLVQNVSALRKALDDKNGGVQYIETVPKGGYRFTAAVVDHTPPARVETVPRQDCRFIAPVGDDGLNAVASNVPVVSRSMGWKALVAVSLLLTGILVGVWLFFPREAHLLTERDTVLLADFTNATGDSVFDDALRQALAVQLEQSPFLSLVSSQRIQETLGLMEKTPDTRVTSNIAREVCLRTDSTAVIEGSIAKLGDDYVVGLNATNCHTGEVLAREQIAAQSKSLVLAGLGKAAREMRGKLGESHTTLAKFDTPLERATTSSLEALNAYSLGVMKNYEGETAASLPFFERAIQLDPNFAMAYLGLGWNYFGLAETSPAVENFKKAYELRDRVSEQEKLSIESAYYGTALGDLEMARQTDELWEQTYPRDAWPPTDLSVIYGLMGEFDKSLVEAKEALRRDSKFAPRYATLVNSYMNLDRLEEAQSAAEKAQQESHDSPYLRWNLHQLAFLRNDATGMAQQVAWSAGNPDAEDQLLASQACTASYYGRLTNAREYLRRAVASAERNKKRESAAGYKVREAAVEALFGNADKAREGAEAALTLSNGHDVQVFAAFALAFAGAAEQARTVADDLAKHHPRDTLVQFVFRPIIQAQLAISRKDSVKALEILRTTEPYELAFRLYPLYVRGEAHLTAHQGREAAVEFQKVVDHRGAVGSEPIGALAHLGLARAYLLQGESTKALAAYKDFLALWKDADPNIPIVKQAKAEYAKLQ
jgi:DNA-binding winged helix-turn-helix (wHTH) protein/tetratricopeptide (TPR) repeat protein